ncbi:MAG: hypothetical protein M0Z53_15415 [Thermaerobacter sp.]|nr:hypothetical protein [Thermaerobacter sp.]
MAANVFAVLGMHRSGTSLLANMLNNMGVYVGDDDRQMVNRFNARGYSENKRVTMVTDTLLHFFGLTWHTPWELKPGCAHDPRLEPASATNAGTVRIAAGVGVKDPRTTITMPFWRRFLPPTDYLISVRNPLAVADSLRERDGMPIADGTRLWLYYTLRAVLMDLSKSDHF